MQSSEHPESSISSALAQHLQLFDRLRALSPQFEVLTRACIETLSAGQKLLLFGNGGSAADAQHLAAELVGRFVRQRSGLAALALSADSAILTAASNDFGFEQVFARQVEALARPGDLVLGLSTSGRSVNVLNGLAVAQTRGCAVWALLGQGPHPIGDLLGPHALCVPSTVTARIQEAHLFLGHVLCEQIDGWFSR